MERFRVLCPSISFAAHCAGAAILVTAPLVLPEGLPPVTAYGRACPTFDGSVAVRLVGAPARGGGPRPVRTEPRATDRRFSAPTLVAPLLPDSTIDLAGGAGFLGLPDDWPDGGSSGGSCLVDCGTGRGDVGTAPPATAEEPARPRLRVGGDVREPIKLRHVSPVYPPLAVASRVGGFVILECVIDEEGRVSGSRTRPPRGWRRVGQPS